MFSRRIGWKSLALVCRSLGTMLHSGVALQKAFATAGGKFGDAACRRALDGVSDQIARGEDIASAMRLQGDAFPDLMIDMVSVAEDTGSLPEILMGLAEHYENNVRLRNNFVWAIAWPLFQLVMAVLIIAFVIFILGWIASMQGGEPIDILGFGLTGTTGALIWLAVTFGTAFGLFVLWQFLSSAFQGRQLIDPLLLNVPVLGHTLRSFAIARFSWAFYLTQQTGMPISRSLDQSLRATSNGAFIAQSQRIRNLVSSGESLSDALDSSGLFPQDFMHMVRVAEASGTVPEALHRMSPQFEDQARRSLSALTATLAWLIWALVAAFIIFLIFRLAMFYVGMISDAAAGI